MAGNSPVHTRDPRVKIIGVIALSIIILQVHYTGLLAATVSTLFIARLARIPLKSLLKTLNPVLFFFLCLFLMYKVDFMISNHIQMMIYQ
jgi:biotin transport system permease protein/energy-coupling factor transport system permease protein